MGHISTFAFGALCAISATDWRWVKRAGVGVTSETLASHRRTMGTTGQNQRKFGPGPSGASTRSGQAGTTPCIPWGAGCPRPGHHALPVARRIGRGGGGAGRTSSSCHTSRSTWRAAMYCKAGRRTTTFCTFPSRLRPRKNGTAPMVFVYLQSQLRLRRFLSASMPPAAIGQVAS